MKCFCCGQEAKPRTTPMTEDQMLRSTYVFMAKGWTIDDLLNKPECVEWLDYQAPGYRDWLRELTTA